MVEVVAPATLREGYTFDVEVNRELFSVTVVRNYYEYTMNSNSTTSWKCIIVPSSYTAVVL